MVSITSNSPGIFELDWVINAMSGLPDIFRPDQVGNAMFSIPTNILSHNFVPFLVAKMRGQNRNGGAFAEVVLGLK